MDWWTKARDVSRQYKKLSQLNVETHNLEFQIMSEYQQGLAKLRAASSDLKFAEANADVQRLQVQQAQLRFESGQAEYDAIVKGHGRLSGEPPEPVAKAAGPQTPPPSTCAACPAISRTATSTQPSWRTCDASACRACARRVPGSRRPARPGPGQVACRAERSRRFRRQLPAFGNHLFRQALQSAEAVGLFALHGQDHRRGPPRSATRSKRGDILATYEIPLDVRMEQRTNLAPTTIKDLEYRISVADKELDRLAAKARELEAMSQRSMASQQSLSLNAKEIEVYRKEKTSLTEQLALARETARRSGGVGRRTLRQGLGRRQAAQGRPDQGPQRRLRVVAQSGLARWGHPAPGNRAHPGRHHQSHDHPGPGPRDRGLQNQGRGRGHGHLRRLSGQEVRGHGLAHPLGAHSRRLAAALLLRNRADHRQSVPRIQGRPQGPSHHPAGK